MFFYIIVRQVIPAGHPRNPSESYGLGPNRLGQLIRTSASEDSSIDTLTKLISDGHWAEGYAGKGIPMTIPTSKDFLSELTAGITRALFAHARPPPLSLDPKSVV